MSAKITIAEFKVRFKEELHLMLSFLKLEIRKELREQGHVLTGTLERSIEDEIQDLVAKMSFIIYLEEYGVNIDGGIPSDKIPFSGITGKGGTSKYIEGLKRFWKLRKGLSDKEASRAAFATANVHKLEGMPTKRSYGFSKNGRRLGFFSGTIERHMSDIERAVESAAESVVRTTLFNMLDKTQYEFQTAS